MKGKSTKYFNAKKMINKGSMTNFSQGKYYVKNKAKCLNKSGIIEYKSSYEAKFCHELDVKRKNVVSWSYETLTVTYKSPIDKKLHRYYIDFIFDVRQHDGSIQKFLVEIKPSHEKEEIELFESKGITPKKHGNMKAESWLFKQRAFLVNVEKWRSAKRYAEAKGYTFLVVTEKDLFGKLNKVT